MLGPHKRDTIHMQVYNDAGNIVSDSDSVMKKWRSEFENLYNKPADIDDQFDDSFYEYVRSKQEVIENKLQIDNAVNAVRPGLYNQWDKEVMCRTENG